MNRRARNHPGDIDHYAVELRVAEPEAVQTFDDRSPQSQVVLPDAGGEAQYIEAAKECSAAGSA